MAGPAPIAAGEWDHSEGLIIAKGDWTDKDGQKHHGFRYPRLIAELPDLHRKLCRRRARSEHRYNREGSLG